MGVYISPDGRFGYAEGGQSVFRLNAGVSGGSSAGSQPAAEPTSPQRKGTSGGLISPWGEDNLFPQAVVKDIEKNTVLPAVLEAKTAAMYGGGLVYGYVSGVDKSGAKVFEGQYVPEIEDFLEGSNVARYAFECLKDINTFGNAFPELILSKNRQKIVGIALQDATWCRYGIPKNGVVDYLYVNANWDNGGSATDPVYTTRIPLIDPYYDAVGNLRSRTDSFNYAYPLSVPSADKALYQLVAWNSLRRSGWLEVAAAIPEFKKMLFKNQLSVKYLVEIHQAYWEWKYGDWLALSLDERKALLEAELTAFNSVMSGTNGAGKTVMATTFTDKKGNEVSAFKITAIDDKLKDGIYIEDSQEASSHIYTAVGYAPALMGVSPGKGMGGGAGGGSEPRVLFSNFISTAQFWMDLVLEPLNLIARYNNWTVNGRPIRFKFSPPLVMTEATANTPAADPKQQSK
ncbi:MAG: hypothetical protein ACRYFX_19625 [Janthinobacterium lividum]